MVFMAEPSEASISGFIAASGVAGLVLGFALRGMIADFFSGIALNLDRSFSLGDHIKLDTGAEGEVVEINWRTTVLRNLPGNHVAVPNSKISEMRIENYSRPETNHLMWSLITLDFDVPIPRAERILTAAVTQAQASIGGHGTPFARVRDITAHGVEYIVAGGHIASQLLGAGRDGCSFDVIAAGGVCEEVLTGAAKQPVEWQIGGLAFNIPQRDVDATDRGHDLGSLASWQGRR
jgi:small-conductance mechanosensitive channel